MQKTQLLKTLTDIGHILRFTNNYIIEDKERLDSHLYSCARFVNIFGDELQEEFINIPNLKLSLYDILLQHDDEEIVNGRDIPISELQRPTRDQEINSVKNNLYKDLSNIYLENYRQYGQDTIGKLAKDIDILLGTIYVWNYLYKNKIDNASFSWMSVHIFLDKIINNTESKVIKDIAIKYKCSSRFGMPYSQFEMSNELINIYATLPLSKQIAIYEQLI